MEEIKKKWILYIFIFCATCIESFLCWETNTADWDILIFTQSWPVTVCLEWKEKNEKHTCIYPKPKYLWTVHGIWPTILGTHKPGFCNTTWKFDPKKIAPIEKELVQYWPNIENGTSKYSLWEHEWEKHGTCAASLPALDNEEKYFRQGIEWAKKYNLEYILSQADIDPSTKELSVQLIADTIRSFTKKNPAVECLRDSKTGEEYLMEIRICFDKQLELTDCDGITVNKGGNELITNCPVQQPVHYPDSIPPKENIYLTLLKIVTYIQWFTL